VLGYSIDIHRRRIDFRLPMNKLVLTQEIAETSQKERWVRTSDLGMLISLALFSLLLHTLTNGQYGFHRDELATLDDARYLDWGYVVYPPFVPFLARVSLTVFGPSLIGLRFFAALAQTIAMVVAGLMARELGGKRAAQLLAAIAVGIGSFPNGSLFEYVVFDYLWWVLAAYFMIRLLRSGKPRWWLAIGAMVGLGAMTKYTMAFLVAGIITGVLLTDARRYLRTRWLWFGVAIAAVICLPNFLWQVHHHFISLDFLKSIHARDVRRGSTDFFLLNQLLFGNPFTAPLWLAGLFYLFIHPAGKRYWAIGWMYVVPLLLFLFARGRPYYLLPAYPMLLAAGSVWGERWAAALAPRQVRIVLWVTSALLAVSGVMIAVMFLPLAPPASKWWAVADQVNGGNFNEEFGWPEMAETAAHIRDSLPAEDRAHLGILVGDAGQAGAIHFYGAAYGLPDAISASNTHYLHGYGNPPAETLIVIGFSPEATRGFQSCEVAGHLTNRYGIKNSAVGDYTEVFMCRDLLLPWPEFWNRIKSFG
jgi:hypothetical protein